MPVNPRFLAARQQERVNRLLIHARALAWLPLYCRGVLIMRTPLVPYTHRQRLDLLLARNAFLTGTVPLHGDIFLFLWRLHPLYRAPRLGCEHLATGRRFRLLRLAWALGSLRAARAHRRLERAVRCCDRTRAIASLVAFLAAAGQDQSGAAAAEQGSGRSALTPERCSLDNLCEWSMTRYRLHPDEVLDLPIALHHQLYREYLLQTPDGDTAVFAPSDALYHAR